MSAPVVTLQAEVPDRARRRRWGARAAWLVGAVALFLCYLPMARAVGTNADGAANALQGWDIVHGNVLLDGWTVSDVSFYPHEVLQLGLLELITGLHPDALTASAAVTYTGIVLLVALLARGRGPATPAGRVRVAIAVSFVLVPAPGSGHGILLNQPDHTGSAVALLLAWLALDRVTSRWMPAIVGAILTLGVLADPLLILLGSAPLVLVSLVRVVRERQLRGRDGALLLAGAASLAGAQLLQLLIRAAGGYTQHPVPNGIVGFDRLGHQLALTRDAIAVLFGFHFHDLHGWVDQVLGAAHLLATVLAVVALVLVTVRWARARTERLDEVIALGIVIVLAAFIVSALNSDLSTAREIAPVLPLTAVLAARVWLPGDSLPAIGRRARLGISAVAVAVVALLATTLVGQVRVPATEPTGTVVADWLRSQHLTYGLGSYWTANTITLDSGDDIRAAPVTGGSDGRIRAYRWESRRQWYDEQRHDARFIIIDLHNTHFGTVAGAIAQFGPPIERVTLPASAGRTATVLVYDHNLLVGLPR